MYVLRVFKVCELMGYMFVFGLMLAYAQLTTNSLIGESPWQNHITSFSLQKSVPKHFNISFNLARVSGPCVTRL